VSTDDIRDSHTDDQGDRPADTATADDADAGVGTDGGLRPHTHHDDPDDDPDDNVGVGTDGSLHGHPHGDNYRDPEESVGVGTDGSLHHRTRPDLDDES